MGQFDISAMNTAWKLAALQTEAEVDAMIKSAQYRGEIPPLSERDHGLLRGLLCMQMWFGALTGGDVKLMFDQTKKMKVEIK